MPARQAPPDHYYMILGDYRGTITDVASEILGRAAGLDQLGKAITGFTAGKASDAAGASAC